jgi:hypothetical protein
MKVCLIRRAAENSSIWPVAVGGRLRGDGCDVIRGQYQTVGEPGYRTVAGRKVARQSDKSLIIHYLHRLYPVIFTCLIMVPDLQHRDETGQGRKQKSQVARRQQKAKGNRDIVNRRNQTKW